MSVGGISDVISRFELVQQQLQQLQDGSLLESLVGGATAPASSLMGSATAPAGSLMTAAGAPMMTAAPASGTFAGALAQAQAADAGSASTPAAGLPYGAGAVAIGPPAATATTMALPESTTTLLTSGQQQFASTLAADTGLDPGVVSAWLLAEESGSAAHGRQTAGNNDWLNIGYTDSGTYGATDGIWSDPVSAANATAAWLQGKDSVAGYGTASPGIQAILQSAGEPPASQIAALQQSGWSSGGYPQLGSLYAQVSSR